MSGERLTFSLASLFGLLTLAAVGGAALNYRTSLWASVIVTVAVLILGFAVVLAVVARRKWRYFWIGFAVFGVGYMLLSFHPWFSNVGGRLLTTRLLAHGWALTDRDDRGGARQYPPFSVFESDEFFADDQGVAEEYSAVMIRSWLNSGNPVVNELRSYLFIGQSLFALSIGFLAGWLTSGLYTLRVRKERLEEARMDDDASTDSNAE